MTENYNWSVSIGRWMGYPIRIHLLLILFAATIFGIEFTNFSPAREIGLGTSIVTFGILLISILIHEFSHVFALNSLGGQANSLVLMPWGGNSTFRLPESTRARLITFAAGPFANAAIFTLGATLLVQSGHVSLLDITNPFRPFEFYAADWFVSSIEISTWINFQLLIVNLIPCFPFDGSAIVRSLIQSFDFDIPKLRIESAIMVIGHAFAFAIIGLSWLVRDYPLGPTQIAWLVMLLGGITLLFTARYAYHKETAFQDTEWNDPDVQFEYDSFYDENPLFDFSDEFEHESMAYSQWLVEKQKSRQQDEEQQIEIEERLADEILEKLHNQGISSLSDQEREILHRLSERIRRRRVEEV